MTIILYYGMSYFFVIPLFYYYYYYYYYYYQIKCMILFLTIQEVHFTFLSRCSMAYIVPKDTEYKVGLMNLSVLAMYDDHVSTMASVNMRAGVCVWLERERERDCGAFNVSRQQKKNLEKKWHF